MLPLGQRWRTSGERLRIGWRARKLAVTHRCRRVSGARSVDVRVVGSADGVVEAAAYVGLHGQCRGRGGGEPCGGGGFLVVGLWLLVRWVGLGVQADRVLLQ